MSLRVYRGRLSHTRTTPRRHSFSYPMAFVAVDLDELPALDRDVWYFGHNRKALVSIFDEDYLEPERTPIAAKLARRLEPEPAPARVVLVTMPGGPMPAYNPLSMYFCYDSSGELFNVGAEVWNPYGERYLYNLRPERQGPWLEASTDKVLYVSLYQGVGGEYRFRFREPAASYALTVDLEVDGQTLVASAMSGALVQGSEARRFAAAALAGLCGQGTYLRVLREWLQLRRKLTPVPRPPAPHAAVRRDYWPYRATRMTYAAQAAPSGNVVPAR